MMASYPVQDDALSCPHIEAEIDWLKEMILAIRNIRGEMNIAPGKKLPLLLRKGTKEDHDFFNDTQTFLMQLARLESVAWLSNEASLPPSASALQGNLELFIPMAGLIDKEAESTRLNKELDKLKKEIDRLANKLNNQSFVDKAPPDVVQNEKKKLQAFDLARAKLIAQLEKLSEI